MNRLPHLAVAPGSEFPHRLRAREEAEALGEVNDNSFAMAALPISGRLLRADEQPRAKLKEERVVKVQGLSEEVNDGFRGEGRPVQAYVRQALSRTQGR